MKRHICTSHRETIKRAWPPVPQAILSPTIKTSWLHTNNFYIFVLVFSDIHTNQGISIYCFRNYIHYVIDKYINYCEFYLIYNLWSFINIEDGRSKYITGAGAIGSLFSTDFAGLSTTILRWINRRACLLKSKCRPLLLITFIYFLDTINIALRIIITIQTISL